jgi:hypothetical protein
MGGRHRFLALDCRIEWRLSRGNDRRGPAIENAATGVNRPQSGPFARRKPGPTQKSHAR